MTKRILLLGTGGTIASRSVSKVSGAVATDGAARLVQSLGAGLEGITLLARDIVSENSFNFTLKDLRAIACAVIEALKDSDLDGIVVTHGTDLIEESAFFLDLVYDDARPVVFTGAQHAADSPDYDGPANIRDAVLVAASQGARGLGALIAFAGRVSLARGTKKNHTLAINPFSSPVCGWVAVVESARMRLSNARFDRFPALPLPGEDLDRVRVDIVVVYPGLSLDVIENSLDRGARALVLLGTGAGNCSRKMLPLIERARDQKVLVLLSTRVCQGPVKEIYGNGGAVDVMARSAINVYDLPYTQARILAAVACWGVDYARAADRVRDYANFFIRRRTKAKKHD